MALSISLIVTARDSTDDSAETVYALRQLTNAEIFLVGSIPEQLIPSPRPPAPTFLPNATPAIARNIAINQANGDILCFIDAGCIPTSDWLAQLLEPFADADVIGVKGTYTTTQTNLIARFAQLEYQGKYNRMRPLPRIDFIDTYSAAYRRETLLANDGFDERFRSSEDGELSFRLAARGYKMVFRPEASVAHDHPTTIRSYTAQKFNIGYWKAQIVSRFPHQSVADSHTPQVIKVQMVITALLGCSVLAAPFFQGGWVAASSLLLLLLATTIPFSVRAAQSDMAVAFAAPLLLISRAVGLGFGYLYGLLNPIRDIPNTHTTIGGLNYIFKRALDVIGGLVGCSIVAAVGPFIALGIKRDSRGPILFAQQRIGLRGRPFKVYKFRTMQHDAEAQLDQLIDVNALDEPAFKLVDDPRVTRFGRILRRWSLDELPQFFNVLKGDMSLIGPRPEETRIVARYNDWQRRRLAVKPGLSGPMQVNGRGDLPLNERVKLEIEYIENYSLLRDLQILWRTLPAVLGGKGAR